MIKNIIKTFLIVLIVQISLQAKEININQIINDAKDSNKHLFVWLHKTDCGYCESMKEFTLQNNIIKSFIDKHFIFMHINVMEKNKITYNGFSGDGRAFAKEVGYDFYPSSLFFDNNSSIVYAEVGYRDNSKLPNEKRFYSILNFIESDSYKKMDYEDYQFNIQEEL